MLTRTALFATLLLPPIANAAPGSVVGTAFGIGSMPCSTWLDMPTHRIDGNSWVLGLFTGLNLTMPKHDVGTAMGGDGVIEEVWNACKTHPEKSLVDATTGVWSRLANDR
jgi:hypothetical protein